MKINFLLMNEKVARECLPELCKTHYFITKYTHSLSFLNKLRINSNENLSLSLLNKFKINKNTKVSLSLSLDRQ